MEPLPASRLPPPPEHSPPRPAGLATAWSCRRRPPSTGMTSAAKPATATSASLVRAFPWLPALAPGPGGVRVTALQGLHTGPEAPLSPGVSG